MLIAFVRGQRFDSHFYFSNASASRNADLVIIVRVRLVRHSPDEHHLGTDEWPAAEWTSFQQKFIPTIEKRFNNKLWLVPSGPCGLECPSHRPRFRPNVKCGIKLQLEIGRAHV